jgi:hypothetical protein
MSRDPCQLSMLYIKVNRLLSYYFKSALCFMQLKSFAALALAPWHTFFLLLTTIPYVRNIMSMLGFK